MTCFVPSICGECHEKKIKQQTPKKKNGKILLHYIYVQQVNEKLKRLYFLLGGSTDRILDRQKKNFIHSFFVVFNEFENQLVFGTNNCFSVKLDENPQTN